MNVWCLYVLAKLVLQYLGYGRIDPIPELLSFALVFGLSKAHFPSRGVRNGAVIGTTLLAVGLFWHESFLPPPEEALRYVVDPALRPAKTYFMEFLGNLFNPWRVAAAAAIVGVAALASRRKARSLALPVLGILLASAVFWPAPDRRRLSSEEAAFFAGEARRSVRLPKPAADFDVIVIQVCSLSWDDLWGTGLQRHPFLSRFDALFTRFNSVASYSDPSSIRLLRAPCGQTRQAALYEEAPPECYLMDALRREGYWVGTALNHSGEYQDMAKKAVQWGHAEPPIALAGLRAAQLNFNGAEIYDDYEVLERWWKARQASGARRAALYYNTVSLHAGAYPLKDPSSWKRDHVVRYREAVVDLFSELSRFMDLVESSGRSAVVIFVPEHGRAIKGSQFLVPGMRDLPLPEITLVPAGVRIIGKGAVQHQQSPLTVTKPVSYLALARLLAELMVRPPFKDPAALAAALASVPETRYVAENRRIVFFPDSKDLYMRWMDKKWVKLPRKFHPDSVRAW